MEAGSIRAPAPNRANSILQVLNISVSVIVHLRLMAGVVVIMVSVLSGMIMIVYVPAPCVRVLVHVLMHVLMGMFVGMLVAVRLAVMRMLVRMRMSVLMGMQMFVFVFSFHGMSSLPPNSLGCRGPS